jgi:hypothetical protein
MSPEICLAQHSCKNSPNIDIRFYFFNTIKHGNTYSLISIILSQVPHSGVTVAAATFHLTCLKAHPSRQGCNHRVQSSKGFVTKRYQPAGELYIEIIIANTMKIV